MECEDDDVHNTKKSAGKNIKNRMKTQDKDSNLKRKLKSKNTHKCKDENIRNRSKTSQNEDSDSMEESENEDAHIVKDKNKNIENRIKTSQNKDSDLKKELKSKDIHKVACKDEDIGNGLKTSQKNSDMKKMWMNRCDREVESEDEDIEEEYCSEATYLARQIASAEKLYQAELLQLYNLRVQLRHAVPPQHQIETRAGSHMPTRKEIEKFEKIIPIKRGSYSCKEDKIIAGNWKAFCKLHNWDIKKTKPFLQLRIGRLTYMRNTTERRKFVQFLADGLPDRTLYSVYHRFKNLYENNLQRRYKPEEDEMIINHLEHNPSLDERCKYADLAKVLRRTRHSIWRRYQILKKKSKKHKDD